MDEFEQYLIKQGIPKPWIWTMYQYPDNTLCFYFGIHGRKAGKTRLGIIKNPKWPMKRL